jgi:hypothetical protein
VAEVKSLTDANEEKQLRLGLGQVLRYRNLMRSGGVVRAVLALERKPTNDSWLGLFEMLDVIAVWPTFGTLLRRRARRPPMSASGRAEGYAGSFRSMISLQTDRAHQSTWVVI